MVLGTRFQWFDDLWRRLHTPIGVVGEHRLCQCRIISLISIELIGSIDSSVSVQAIQLMVEREWESLGASKIEHAMIIIILMIWTNWNAIQACQVVGCRQCMKAEPKHQWSLHGNGNQPNGDRTHLCPGRTRKRLVLCFDCNMGQLANWLTRTSIRWLHGHHDGAIHRATWTLSAKWIDCVCVCSNIVDSQMETRITCKSGNGTWKIILEYCWSIDMQSFVG